MAARQRQRLFIIGGLLLLALLGAAAYFYTQGTLFATGCNWQPVEYPDTGDAISTVYRPSSLIRMPVFTHRAAKYRDFSH